MHCHEYGKPGSMPRGGKGRIGVCKVGGFSRAEIHMTVTRKTAIGNPSRRFRFSHSLGPAIESSSRWLIPTGQVEEKSEEMERRE